MMLNNTNFSNETHVPTPPYGQYLTHAHNHINPAVAAMDGCFVLIRTHQHGLARWYCIGYAKVLSIPRGWCNMTLVYFVVYLHPKRKMCHRWSPLLSDHWSHYHWRPIRIPSREWRWQVAFTRTIDGAFLANMGTVSFRLKTEYLFCQIT